MIAIRDLTGRIQSWIDIGTPDGARLHKASKATERVVVYCHKDPGQWLKQLADAKIHRAGTLELYSIDRTLIADLVTRMDRRMSFAVSISGRELFVAIGTDNLTGHVSATQFVGRRRPLSEVVEDRLRRAGVSGLHCVVSLRAGQNRGTRNPPVLPRFAP